jgi:hypothetical protein
MERAGTPAPADPWVQLLAAVLLRAVEDVKLQRTYGIFTAEDKARAQSNAWRFLVQAGPLFDLVGIDHSAAVNALGFSRENICDNSRADNARS